MARYRTIKPELFADEKLNECSVDARFLFVGLLPFVDDMGRRQYHPRRVKAEVFPVDEEFNWQVVDALVQELAACGVIELYEIGKQRYLRIPHFLRHQYVRKPGHCYVPPSPTEGPNAERCRCAQCRLKSERNGDDPDVDSYVPAGTYRTSELPVTHKERTGDALVSEEWSPEGKGREGKGVYRAVKNTHTQGATDSSTDPPTLPEPSEKDRRAAIRASEEIALRSLRLLEIHPNPHNLTALAEAIRTKAKSRACSVELAAQQIMARAALLKVESPPDDWPAWIADSRYEYVPQGDSRLNERHIQARPVCGGPQCEEGWERFSVNGTRMVRRCADCRRLWREQGIA